MTTRTMYDSLGALASPMWKPCAVIYCIQSDDQSTDPDTVGTRLSGLSISILSSAKYTDNETGLLYYGYRYYQPGSGRWVNRDPIEESDGASIYTFTANNPFLFVDPLGLAAQELTGENTFKPYETEGPLNRKPRWAARFPAGDDAGGTLNTQWDLDLAFDPSPAGKDKGAIRISQAACTGQMWYKDDFAKRHEEVHISDHKTLWVAFFNTVKSFTGECRTQKEYDCYKGVKNQLVDLFRPNMLIYFAALRHTSDDALMRRNDVTRYPQDNKTLFEREKDTLRIFEPIVRQKLLEAQVAKFNCDHEFRGGPANITPDKLDLGKGIIPLEF